jgi:hypothetical protein
VKKKSRNKDDGRETLATALVVVEQAATKINEALRVSDARVTIQQVQNQFLVSLGLIWFFLCFANYQRTRLLWMYTHTHIPSSSLVSLSIIARLYVRSFRV